jgi:mannosyl-oligosaccharide alpha-1,2-mannosidase
MNKKKFKTGWKRIPRDAKGNLIREEKKEERHPGNEMKDSHPGGS